MRDINNKIIENRLEKGGGSISDEIGPLQKFGFFVLKLSHNVF
jgi:hypothetical protein